MFGDLLKKIIREPDLRSVSEVVFLRNSADFALLHKTLSREHRLRYKEVAEVCLDG